MFELLEIRDIGNILWGTEVTTYVEIYILPRILLLQL